MDLDIEKFQSTDSDYAEWWNAVKVNHHCNILVTNIIDILVLT